MKQIVLYLFAGLLSLGANANPANDAKAKEVLKVIRLAYSCSTSNAPKFVGAGEYLTDPATHKIIGQNLLNGTAWTKYDKVTLTWDGDNITKANLDMNGDYAVNLKWANDRVSEVAIQGLYQVDYTVNYNEKGEVVGFIGNEVIYKNRKNSFIVEYTGDQINKITGYQSQISKEPWILNITTFTYNNNVITGNTIQYKQWESNKPKNIKSDYTEKVEKLGEDRYLYSDPFGGSVEKTFDKDNGKVIVEKSISKTGAVTTHTYKYADNKMWKEDIIETTAAGAFTKRTIKVGFSLKDQPESVADYDKTEGWYELNKDGECIYEKRGIKERKKENGVWGDWKQIAYRSDTNE
jgi:hypothetical protein